MCITSQADYKSSYRTSRVSLPAPWGRAVVPSLKNCSWLLSLREESR